MLKPVQNNEQVYKTLDVVVDALQDLMQDPGCNNREEMYEEIEGCMAHLNTVLIYLNIEAEGELA